MATRGGAGRGQGRKPKPKIEAVASKEISVLVLSKVDEVKLWSEYLHAEKKLDALTDLERKERQFALDRLTNRKYGLPAQQVIAGGKIVLEVVELADRSPAKTG